MRKSEKVSAQFDIIINYLDLVDHELQKLPVEYADQSVCYSLHNKIQELLSEIEDFHYETCGPLQAAEDDAEAEIARLEKRIFELKSSL